MNSRQASFRARGLHGALWAPVAMGLYAAIVLVGLLLATWCIDCVFVFHIWPDGIARLRAVLVADLEQVAAIGSPGESVWPRLAEDVANGLYAAIFRWTGIHDMGWRFAANEPLSIPDTMVRSSYIAYRDAIEVAMIGTQLFGVRLTMLAGAVPIGVLVYGVGMADGLVARAIRRARGGHESSNLYHRFKYLQLLGIATVISVGLLIPASIDPRTLWTIAAAPLGVLVRCQWLYYKKYL